MPAPSHHGPTHGSGRICPCPLARFSHAHPVLHRLEPRRLRRSRAGGRPGLVAHPRGRRRRAAGLQRVHRGGGRDRDGCHHLPVAAGQQRRALALRDPGLGIHPPLVPADRRRHPFHLRLGAGGPLGDGRGRRGEDAWVAGGGDLVGQFHDHGLLDEIWVQYAPVTLGAGAPLLPCRIEFEEIAQDPNGDFACRRLRVKR
ncbi:MAG TPA: dihydrofolate reductase family protein [Marmoricola sp.]|nr:dihydrofolate reductase family protein [Marmoricola sp.]